MKKPPYTILYLNDYLHGMGGAERNLIQLLEGIDRQTFKPIVCCLSGGELAVKLEAEGFEIYNRNVKRIYDLHGLKSFLWLLQLIRSRDVRLIVSYHESSDFLGLVVGKLTGIPVISSRRDMGYKLKQRHITAYRFLNKHFSCIVAVSEAVKKAIERREKTLSDKIVVIPNGVDPGAFSNHGDPTRVKKEFGVKPQQGLVGMIASLRQVKGHRYFIEAASKVVKEIPETMFLIVGKDYHEAGCSEKDLTSLSHHLHVNKNVIFAGERKDIPDLLAAMDVVVNPSLSEGMSNTVLEAMAAGRPVIASAVGGNLEVIRDHETGYLFAAKDVDRLSELITRCLRNREESQRMGKNARTRAMDFYSLKAMNELNMALYLRHIKNAQLVRASWLKRQGI
jgi:glycosyltransferase involved in cell wall biosynthesis